MPYKSDAQRKFFHTNRGLKKVGASVVAEFDHASKGRAALIGTDPKKRKKKKGKI